MKKLLICICCIIGFWACSGKKSVSKTNAVKPETAVPAPAKNESGINEFVRRFEQAMISHDKVTMVALMDKDYKIQRHDNFYKNNTDAFLDKFFCNNRIDGQGFKCIKFAEIAAFKKIDILPNGENYTLVYHIAEKDIVVKCDWIVVARKEAGKTVYGFYGPTE